MEQQIQLVAAIGLFGIGLSYLFQPSAWLAEFGHMQEEGKREGLKIGALNLLFGAIVLVFHPVWEGWPLLLTILGIIALFKGIIHLVCPSLFMRVFRSIDQSMRPLLMVSGVVLIMISGMLFSMCSPTECLGLFYDDEDVWPVTQTANQFDVE